MATLEQRGTTWVVVDDGCRPATPVEIDLWRENDALRADIQAAVKREVTQFLDAIDPRTPLGEEMARRRKELAERDALREALRDLRRVYDRNVDPFDACAVYDRIDALLREEKDG